MRIVRLEREKLVLVLIDFFLAEFSGLDNRACLLTHLLQRYLIVLRQRVLALKDQIRCLLAYFADVQSEQLQDEFQRGYQVVQVVPEFVHEKWLDDLVIEEYAFRYPGRAISLLRDVGDRELLVEDGIHLMVLVLEGAHDVLASDDQVHHARYQDARVVALGLEADCNQVYEVHQRQILPVALLVALKELEMELVLQVRQRLVYVIIPPLHEPCGPIHGGLEPIEVPFKHLAHF